jgi:hypothetical protein
MPAGLLGLTNEIALLCGQDAASCSSLRLLQCGYLCVDPIVSFIKGSELANKVEYFYGIKEKKRGEPEIRGT